MTQTELIWDADKPEPIVRQLRNLKPDQAFTVELEPGKVVHGRLIYANQCRAYVELDGKPQTREFHAKGEKIVRFTDSGKKKTSWPLELEVEVKNA